MPGILIIDDDVAIRSMMSQILSSAGYQVSTAADGKAGINLYRENPTDLIITDLVMPEKDGIELIMELRREFPQAKVIAMSGGSQYGNMDYLKTARMLGALRVLDKPFEIDTLLQIVSESIGE